MRKLTKGALIVSMAALIAGCGDKKESHESASADAGKIKIVENAVSEKDNSVKGEENSGQFYYSYNKEKKESEEEKVRTTLDAYLNIRSPYERVQIEMMIHKLSKDFRIKCSPCHDDYANGVIGPSLLDKNGTFIYDKLMAFKSGKEKNVLMKQLVGKIDDEKLRSLADEIAVFNKQIQEMRRSRK